MNCPVVVKGKVCGKRMSFEGSYEQYVPELKKTVLVHVWHCPDHGRHRTTSK